MPAEQGEVVTLEGNQVRAVLPEGTQGTMKISDLLERLRPSVPDTCGVILPDGVKTIVPIAGGLVLVHQTPPKVYSFRWIADDSEAAYGPGTSYRTVRIALPYVIVLAVFGHTGRRGLVLGDRNECFFANEPLEVRGLKSPLAYPALLNCSLIGEAEQSISWICTQHLSRSKRRPGESQDSVLRGGLSDLLQHLLESGFNRSSEEHEGASGFSASTDAGIDPRIASVEDWEKATLENPLFVLDVPWLPTGKSLGEIVGRIHSPSRRRPAQTFETAADIARVIFNASGTAKGG
jgi:hypothetical protein